MKACRIHPSHAKRSTSRLVADHRGSRTHTTNAPANDNRNARAARHVIDSLLPRSRFASSVFTTPLLLFFRLFYQATSFESYDAPPFPATPRVTVCELLGKLRSAVQTKTSRKSDLTYTEDKWNGELDISSKVPVESWYDLLQNRRHAISPASRVISMTWIKSLSAPLSHEFVQFVVECRDTHKRYRLITERDTDGDWAYFIASSSTTATNDAAIKVLRQYDYQHDLPLPLLSVSWARLPRSKQPTLIQLASTCEGTRKLWPEYNFMRQHCWWYAEKLFEQMLGQSPSDASVVDSDKSGPELKQWPGGIYRYSYIVLGKRMLRRDGLIVQARRFRKDMDEDDQIRW